MKYFNLKERIMMKKQEKSDYLNNLIKLDKLVKNAILDYGMLFNDTTRYVELSDIISWKTKNKYIHDQVSQCLVGNELSNNKLPRSYQYKFEEIPLLYSRIEKKRIKHNRHLLHDGLQLANDVLAIAGMTRTDKKQLSAVIKEDRTNLVIGGAGTGKSTVAVARAMYILRKMKCRPNELIFFTNSDQHNFITEVIGTEAIVTSFRDEALRISNSLIDNMPKMIDIDVHSFFNDEMQKTIEDVEYLNRLIDYVLLFKFDYGTAFDFPTEELYKAQLKNFPAITLRGDIVKSYEHRDVSNFLYRNGINYEYDKPYIEDEVDYDRSRYKEAFFLPDFNIYIECFEIDRKGSVPENKVSPLKSKKTPVMLYREHMNRIREIHREHGTKLIEVFSYEKIDSTLFVNLEKKLLREGVIFSPLEPNYIWDIICKINSLIIPELEQLFISLFKMARSRNYNDEQLLNTNRNQNRTYSFGYKRNESILSLFIPFYKKYISILNTPADESFLDEESLMYKAEHLVKHNMFVSPYKYIIVDNYQNITKPQLSLLKALKEQNNSYIFCTADDWQCLGSQIGSDVNFTVDFDRYWGPSEVSILNNCYSNCSRLTDLSRRFITQNSDQLRKIIHSVNDSIRDCFEIIECDDMESLANTAFKRINELSGSGSVSLIGRYPQDFNTFEGKIPAQVKFYPIFQNEKIASDYIFIVNNLDNEMGFPCSIIDDGVLELVCEKYESYKNAQERRLFYYAITRASKKVVFLCIKGRVSEFVKELQKLLNTP